MKEDFIVWLNTSTGWQLPDAARKLSETVCFYYKVKKSFSEHPDLE